jgi:gliding motility-associated-like protein
MKLFYTKAGLLLILVTLFGSAVYAQSGCPNINAGNDLTLPCSTTCTNLTATYFETGGAATYTVGAIPYTPFPYNAGTAVIVNDDDIWSTVIDLPFTFCFFDQPYTQLVIGANGIISFDVTEADQTCAWALTGTPNPTLPNSTLYTNSIMGPYHDIDPSINGDIKYQIGGVAPCRTFVVSYSAVAMYGTACTSTTDATHQIALYETTNVIEVYIKDKASCSGWNSGLAIEGIQNASGTVGYAVPGRNNTVWDATNDAYRFTPSGTSIVTVNWFEGATQVATGSTFQACPSQQTTYTAQATYVPCSGGTPVVVTDNVTISLSGTLSAGIDSSKNITCFGLNNGAAYAHVSGGTAPINYGWADGSNLLTRTNLSPGTYVFTATDAANCVRADTVIITQPAQMTVNVPDVSQTNCSGSGSGVLVATVNGGFAPYSFVWNSTPVQTDSILDNVTAGTYSVTVTSTGGCTATDNGTLTIQAGGNNVTINSPTITDVSCNGGNDGAITTSATGGSGIFTYDWSNLQSGATINSLAAGAYTVSVNDGAGCTATATYNVTQPAALIINAANITNIGCGGNLSGSITANVSGGTPSYTYNWSQQSNSQSFSGQTITGLTADVYNVTVADINGCSATDAYTVTQVPALTYTQSSTNVSCNGGNDGTATIAITAGTAPYSYDWNGTGAQANATLSTASAGVVSVTFTDANCSVTTTFTITEPTAIVIAEVSQTSVSCNGGSDGTETISVSGGTTGVTGYTYLWSNTQTGTTATTLSAGSISVTVTDENLCTATQSFIISEPSILSATTSSTNSTCYQSPDGSVTVVGTGGTVPYTYLWSDAQTTATAINLLAGSYNCTVTDFNGCTVTSFAVVGEPADILLTTSSTAVKCIGDLNGTITGSAIGGTSPYTFSATLDGVNFTYDNNGLMSGLGIGDYTVSVLDASGCSSSVIQNVPNATPDIFSFTTDSTSCYGADYNDGSVYISGLSFQNGPFQFAIDGGGYQYSGDFYNLSAGNHVITAINFNGCVTPVSVVVYEPLPIIVNINPDSLLLPLGESQAVQVDYLNASGVTYSWTPVQGLSCSDCANPIVNSYIRQDYVVTVSSINGSATCYGSASLHVEVEPHKPLFIPNSFTPNGDGNNDLFQIFGEDIKVVDLKIFNRWGELVYQCNNQFAGWDGTYKAQLQLPQVFTYTAVVTFLDDKKAEKNGTVTLVR